VPHSIHTKNIAERMRWLAELGAEHSRIFASPEAYLQRRRYQAEHPTAILAFKCMDGRIHLPYITKTPLGIIQPFRNLGGAFDIGWPHLGELVTHEVLRAVEAGRRVLILVTYHHSRGERSRGCSGFDFDLEAARSSAFAFRRQLESVFGSDHQTVYPLVVGIETDEDALTLHWDRGTAIDLATFESADCDEADRCDELFFIRSGRVIAHGSGAELKFGGGQVLGKDAMDTVGSVAQYFSSDGKLILYACNIGGGQSRSFFQSLANRLGIQVCGFSNGVRWSVSWDARRRIIKRGIAPKPGDPIGGPLPEPDVCAKPKT